VAGDWRIYVDLLAHSQGKVAYLSAPLNRHRRHGESLTGSLSRPDMIAEIARVHAEVNRVLRPDPARETRQLRYRATLAA
jgi:hypothetical protein